MVGFIQPNKIFEFKDLDDLSFALSYYGNQYDYDVLFIVDKSTKLKGLLYKENWKITPDIDDEVDYLLYKTNSKYCTSIPFDELQKNDTLEDFLTANVEIDWTTFTYYSCKVPKTI